MNDLKEVRPHYKFLINSCLTFISLKEALAWNSGTLPQQRNSMHSITQSSINTCACNNYKKIDHQRSASALRSHRRSTCSHRHRRSTCLHVGSGHALLHHLRCLKTALFRANDLHFLNTVAYLSLTASGSPLNRTDTRSWKPAATHYIVPPPHERFPCLVY